METLTSLLQGFGLWILLTFVIYYLLSLLLYTQRWYNGEYTLGTLFLGAILSLGLVLVF